MKSYKIERWDSIIPNGSSNSLPMIYINADSDLIQFAQKNNYKIKVEVRDTNSIYDHKQITGIFDSLLLGPNCKSKFIKDKNWHTVCLNSFFYLYPPKLGKIIILGLDDNSNPINKILKNIPEIIKNVKNKDKTSEIDNKKEALQENNSILYGLSTIKIILVLLLLFLILLILFIKK